LVSGTLYAGLGKAVDRAEREGCGKDSFDEQAKHVFLLSESGFD
jgi:hypothetical protein